MFENLKAVEARFHEVSGFLTDPTALRNQEQYRRYAKEHAELKEIVSVYEQYKLFCKEMGDNRDLLNEADDELRELARQEIERLKEDVKSLEEKLKFLLLPKDPNDEKNIILEIRAGTGGEEAALFVANLFRMYCKYAELRHWKVEIMSRNTTGLGGFKEIISLIQGERVYSRLKYEAGVHRVQRIPETEAQGRIHTSAVTVAVLPEADEIEVNLDPSELRIDIYRSSGPGGQSVNTTDSAVRITHLPSGMVVICQDEKSQHKNKAKAMKVLYARLKDKMVQEQNMEIAEKRKIMVGSGDRSQRIRTYNFPQRRVTDHRIGLTLYRLEDVLEGQMDFVIDPLIAHFQAETLKRQET